MSRSHVREVHVVDNHAAAGGRMEGAEQADDGGFSRAGRTDERGDRARLG